MKGTPMYYVREIMELLNLDEEMARKVFAWMDLDCSECTQAEFDADARHVYKMIKAGVYK
jgi:hypothetical protein